VLRSISLCRHAGTYTPAEPWGASVARFPHDGGLPRFDDGSASATMFRGLIGVHLCSSLPARRTAQGSPHIEGFGEFVTSFAAPIATGWSDLAGRDFHPLKIAGFARRTSKSTAISTLLMQGRRRFHFRLPALSAPFLAVLSLFHLVLAIRWTSTPSEVPHPKPIVLSERRPSKHMKDAVSKRPIAFPLRIPVDHELHLRDQQVVLLLEPFDSIK
jgi:hypothetical protein